MSENATECDRAGNTKQLCKREAKGWFLTLNNYSKLELTDLLEKCDKLCKKYKIQEETGECGTPHLQGCIELHKKLRFTAVAKWNKRIHWEITRNSEAAEAYCEKAETHTGLRWSKGYPRPVKILPEAQLKNWQLEINKIIEKEPDDRTIHWYYGAGGIGKTTYCKYLSVKYGAIPLSGKSADMKNGVIEYKKSNGDTPRVVIIPIPRTFNYDYISYEGIEQIKDMYFYSGKYEGGVVCGNCPHVIIFANREPEKDSLSADRWVIQEIQ